MKYVSTIFCLILISTSFSQQIAQYSQYLTNRMLINPAACGLDEQANLNIGGRWQWVGFGDEPRTAFLYGGSIINNKKPRYNPGLRISQDYKPLDKTKNQKLKHAIGGIALADQYGAFRRMSLGGTYAMHFKLNNDFNISFGTRVGMTNNSFLQDKAIPLNPSNPLTTYAGGDNGYDSYIMNNTNKYILDIGAGIYLHSKKMFFGVSADQLTKDFVELGSGTVNFNTQIHYNALIGANVKLNENMMFVPSILIKNMRPAPISSELTMLLKYKNSIWFGTSYRNKDALIGVVGLQVNRKIRVGYSFDFSISRMNHVSSGGHELVMGIKL
jgi:type IX secretion system PorP/SprF family membrane protein